MSDDSPSRPILPPPPTQASARSSAPQPADFLRALVAPAVGYEIALCGGIAATLLILVALAAGLDADSAGSVNSSDAEGIMVVLGMPFQLVGMALFGKLGFEDDGVRGSVYAVPILLSALFVIGTAVAARRSERRWPTSPSQQLVTSGVSAFLSAIVVLSLSFLFAMKIDGTPIRTTSPGLFFGTLVLAWSAMLVGRMGVDASRAP